MKSGEFGCGAAGHLLRRVPVSRRVRPA